MNSTVNTTSFATHYIQASIHLMDAVAHIGEARTDLWFQAKSHALRAQQDAGTTEESVLADRLIVSIDGTKSF